MVRNGSSGFCGVSSDCGVVTDVGLLSASEVRPGDEVLTRSGEYERVVEVISTGEVKQDVWKISVPLVEEPFVGDVYVSSECSVYGRPSDSGKSGIVGMSALRGGGFIFLPEEVTLRAPLLRHQLRGDAVIKDDDGVFVPVGRVVEMRRQVNLISFVTESGSFVAGGLTIEG